MALESGQFGKGVAGKNGGINIYDSGEFQVVIVTLGRFERWSVERRVKGAGMRIKKADKFERRFFGDTSVVAYFDPEVLGQTLLALELARVPMSHVPGIVTDYLTRAGWSEGEPPTEYRRKDQRWCDPLARQRWFNWQDAYALQRERDRRGLGKGDR